MRTAHHPRRGKSLGVVGKKKKEEKRAKKKRERQETGVKVLGVKPHFQGAVFSSRKQNLFRRRNMEHFRYKVCHGNVMPKVVHGLCTVCAIPVLALPSSPDPTGLKGINLSKGHSSPCQGNLHVGFWHEWCLTNI